MTAGLFQRGQIGDQIGDGLRSKIFLQSFGHERLARDAELIDVDPQNGVGLLFQPVAA